MKSKVLFITSHFYPNGSIVEAKNNYLSLLELEKNGFLVDVAAPAANLSYPPNVKFSIEVRNRASIRSKFVRRFRKLMRIPLMPISFDDVSAFVKGLENVDFLKYDYIYTVFGNGSEHLVGKIFKKAYPHLRWIAEFRDPWVHNELSRKYLYDTSFFWYAEYQWKQLAKKESQVLKDVDLLLVESNYHGNLIKNDFDYEKEIFVCNGYSDHFLADIPLLDVCFSDKPVIGFLGSTYYGYDDVAETFISVLEELESEGRGLVFIAVGNNSFAKMSSTSSLSNFFAFHKMSYLKTQALIGKLTYGLAITMESYPNHVNSKIFEYMQYGKPTLAIAPAGGAMDMLLGGNACGVTLPYEKHAMKNRLREVLQHASSTDVSLSASQVSDFDREKVFRKIVHAIHALE